MKCFWLGKVGGEARDKAGRIKHDLHEGENNSVSGGSWATKGYERGLWWGVAASPMRGWEVGGWDGLCVGGRGGTTGGRTATPSLPPIFFLNEIVCF